MTITASCSLFHTVVAFNTSIVLDTICTNNLPKFGPEMNCGSVDCGTLLWGVKPEGDSSGVQRAARFGPELNAGDVWCLKLGEGTLRVKGVAGFRPEMNCDTTGTCL
jgi:hypothetical protein